MPRALFWLAAAVIYLGYREATGGHGGQIPSHSWWRIPYDFAWQSAPLNVLVRACRSPDLFSPLSPSYWIHFLTALFGFRLASVVMINRFRSIRGPTEADLESTRPATKSVGSGRPRCTDAPHFWKDTQILAGGYRSQRFLGLAYGMIAVAVLFIGVAAPDHEAEFSLSLAIIAECLWPIIFAVPTADGQRPHENRF